LACQGVAEDSQRQLERATSFHAIAKKEQDSLNTWARAIKIRDEKLKSDMQTLVVESEDIQRPTLNSSANGHKRPRKKNCSEGAEIKGVNELSCDPVEEAKPQCSVGGKKPKNTAAEETLIHADHADMEDSDSSQDFDSPVKHRSHRFGTNKKIDCSSTTSFDSALSSRGKRRISEDKDNIVTPDKDYDEVQAGDQGIGNIAAFRELLAASRTELRLRQEALQKNEDKVDIEALEKDADLHRRSISLYSQM
jgi:hypothetical protein